MLVGIQLSIHETFRRKPQGFGGYLRVSHCAVLPWRTAVPQVVEVYLIQEHSLHVIAQQLPVGPSIQPLPLFQFPIITICV